MSFENFLDAINPAVAKEYQVDAYMAKGQKSLEAEKPAIFLQNTKKKPTVDPLSLVKKISQLKHDHPAKLYVNKRQIPPSQHFKIYYTPKFKTWIRKVDPERFPEVEKQGFKDEPRLLFPFVDEKGKCFGVAARSFDPNSTLRYMSIMFEERLKVFGLQSVDMNKDFHIVEGAVDSMFLSNAVAMAGADGNFSEFSDKGIFVFDNEPRNTDIHKRMLKLLKAGKRVCIWPSAIKQKDINEMHLAGVTDIEQIINDNIYTGLSGELALSTWAKRDEESKRNHRNRL